MRFAFIAKHRQIWPVSWLCEVLEVSCSGFHAWLTRPLSDRAILDAKLVTAIDTSFKGSDRTYGARRVWHDFLEVGLLCGLHRIERLKRQNALTTSPKRRGMPQDDGERSVIAITTATENDSPIGTGILLYRARAFAKRGLPDAAIDVLTRALRLRKDRPERLLHQFRYDRADLYERVVRRAQSRRELERLYAEVPGFEGLTWRLGLE